MSKEKPRAVKVFGGPGGIRDHMGPLMVDNAIRQAIQHCWMMLPEEKRTAEKVEQEIRRLVDRALEAFKEDADAFDLGAEDTE